MSEEHHAIDQPKQRDYDSFFLSHLQSVRADGAWYVNQHLIGRGGNGTTFFVTCTSGEYEGMQFALKVFHKVSDESRRRRFIEEVRHYKTLSHPAIIRTFDEGVFTAAERQYPFAVMDYIPTNLEAKLGRGPPRITRLDAIRHVSNVMSGVSYLHAQDNPIVHRDIKPANILVDGHSARLGDLGLAKVLMGAEDEQSDDVAAYIAMPRFYRTPELVQIARGEDVELSPASDIYQLGLVLYRAMTGFNPQRPPKDNVKEDIALDVRKVVGRGSTRLNSLLLAMLAERAADRPTAKEALKALTQIHREICEGDFDATGMMR